MITTTTSDYNNNDYDNDNDDDDNDDYNNKSHTATFRPNDQKKRTIRYETEDDRKEQEEKAGR